MPKISLSGPSDLLTVLPYHLGFRPERSVVVATFRGRRLGLVARLDVVDPAQVVDAVARTVPSLVRDRPDAATLVAYESRPGEAIPLLDALRDDLTAAGLAVRERLVVRDGRWFGLDCGCCPAPGRRVPDDADVPAVADFVALGTLVLDGREDLERLLEPAPSTPGGGARAELVAAAVDAWRPASGSPRRCAGARAAVPPPDASAGADVTPVPDLDAFLVAWSRLLGGDLDAGPGDADVAALVGPLVDLQVRDALVAWLCPGTLPLDAFPDALVGRMHALLPPDASEDAELGRDADWELARSTRARMARLEALCRSTPAAHAAPVLAVTAAYAWWCGDGARASVAVDRALACEPGHRLSQLIRRSLDHGLRPRATA